VELEFLFADHMLDIDRRELRRGGERIALEPQVFDLLVYLVRNRERVVSKDDLLEAIWGGRIVSESTVTSRINAARKAVGDSGEAQRLIRTVPRKGIRFVGAVQERQKLTAMVDAPPEILTEPSRPAVEALYKPSIAVLPFANLGGDAEQKYFAEGVVNEIITALSRIHWLSVMVRNSSFTYKGQAVDVKQVDRELGVHYVLEGSVRNAAGRIRIAAQLIDAASGAHLWAERFDGSAETIFELQDQVAIGVAAAIESVLHSSKINWSADLREQTNARDARLPEPISEERRQLTVMYCNLVESTGLASRLDPEDLRDLTSTYHRAITEIVTRFEGFVAKHPRDGALIYFGFPRAREDDAERAIRCALTVADAVTRLELDEELRTSVGIATSMVVIGDPSDSGGSEGPSIVGEAPSLAARLQRLAAPNSVLIAESTRRLVGELFEYQAVEVTGIGGPVPAWQVLRPSVVASRFEALRGLALTPLVGREEEIDLLLRRWSRAKTGDGQVVLVSGEPGLGKSRITAALEERLHAEPHLRLRYFCSPYHQDSALYPFIDQLGRAAEFAREDMPAAKLEKLEALLARAAPPDEDIAFLADLLSLPASERHPLPQFSPQRKKERTLEALIRQLEGLARRQPLVMVFEDAHWIDPTSRELLDLTVERARTLPVLLIITFRLEFQPPWAGQTQVTTLALNRLDQRDRIALVAQIARVKALPYEVVGQIADRTDGVPLFVEELTKSILESGLLREEVDRYVLDGALPPFAIPTSLQDSLMARLDRLPAGRQVAQVGAVIGREFPHRLLATVAGLPEAQLAQGLNELIASGLASCRGIPSEATYTFKHALVQDAAYESLPKIRRAEVHAAVVTAFEDAPFFDIEPGVLAYHCAQAGLVAKAAIYYRIAGERSIERAAAVETRVQLERGLEFAATLPDGADRYRLEAELLLALADILQLTGGMANVEAGVVLERSIRVCRCLDRPQLLSRALWGQFTCVLVRGEVMAAQAIAEELLKLAEDCREMQIKVAARAAMGISLFYRGRFHSARQHLAILLSIFAREPEAANLDWRTVTAGPAFLALTLACLGYPEQAGSQISRAIDWASRKGLFALAYSLSVAVRVLLVLRDDVSLQERALLLVTLSEAGGYHQFLNQGLCALGWLKATKGATRQGLDTLRGGLAGLPDLGVILSLPFYRSLLADALPSVECRSEAIATLTEALQISCRTADTWFTAELYRRRGELLLAGPVPDAGAAETELQRALAIARDQSAKLFELRAAASLARLWAAQGKCAEARDLLAPVYGWFTEGFDTPDLKQAKVLLKVLNG
jgi:TolB-like protein/predicted ATPase